MAGFCPMLLRLSLLGLCVVSAALYSVWRAQCRLADSLDRHLENRPLSIQLRVTGLPRDLVNGWAFEAQVLTHAHAGRLPERILLRWYAGARSGPYAKPRRPAAGLPDLRPGQVWQMTVKLKRIHTPRNFHGFDYDAYLFAAGIRASGSVNGAATLLRDESCRKFGPCIERMRFELRRAMNGVLQQKRFGPVLIALVMGDQNGIGNEDWKIFNLTGITHLVSISGSHITMLAAMGSLGVFRLWRHLRLQGKLLADRRPAQMIAATAGLLVAGIYSLLAGWGVPAQRTFIMLAILWLSVVWRVRLKGATLLSVTAFAILLLDPWAVLSVGFCLSFAAVAGLMLWGARLQRRVSPAGTLMFKIGYGLKEAAAMQLFMSVALAPLLIGLFHQYAFVSPLVNAFAIPAIGALVTPLALLLAVLCATRLWPQATIWLADGVHRLLELTITGVRVISEQDWAALHFPAPPGHWVVLGMVGLCLFVLPKGFPGRILGLLLLIPVLFYRPPRPSAGDWFMTVLDVGQGAAVLVSTRHHNVLFDTGVRSSVDNDSGNRIIVPYLQAMGVSTIDQLIVSHSDLDHAGGAGSVLQELAVRHAYAPFALNYYLEREQRALARDIRLKAPQATYDFCQRDVAFEYDGVQFRFYHPFGIAGMPLKADNDHSCVLRIVGRHHSALLSGDIGTAVEGRLLAAKPPIPPTDVVMAPHHGSANSSSPAFVQAMRPTVVFAQAGYLNRYGHPASKVAARWRDSAQWFFDTIQAGAIRIESGADGLWVNSARLSQRRYWDGF
ncbi:DNA internalization-related competence protein ComEC/Rec2 [Advenella sp. S44]|uniref:DNA internalization-related competence protein ComEC/Rec2 n=1 Tax=Advenella sp. S44 TaxID=1982755 RepID=UPI00350FD3B8